MDLKNQKGSITLFVLVSCLFFLASVACINMYMQSKQVAVDREYRQIKANYEKDINNMEEIYTELAGKNNVAVSFGIPDFDKTKDKVFLDVYTNLEYYNVNTLKYGWYTSNTSTDTPSINNIENWTYVEHQNGENEFIASSNISENNRYYYLCVLIDNKAIWKKTYDDYIEDGMVLHYDGINNAGQGDNNHNSSATEWVNLCELGNDEVLHNGILNGPVWGENYLSFDGIDDWVNAGLIKSDYQSIEAVFTVDSFKNYDICICGDWQSGGGGIIAEKQTQKFLGDYHIGGGYRVNYPSSNKFELEKKYSVTLTYDGEKVISYLNGQHKNNDDNGATSIQGIISPSTNTVMGVGANPKVSNAEGQFLEGKIYSIRIYNRGLTANEVKQNYNKDKNRFNIQD